MLCDSSCLTANYICMTDGIQKRSFTVVNVSHNTDNRRTLLHFLFVLFFFFEKLFDHIDNFFFFTEYLKFQCNLFRCLVIDFLIDRYDLALHKELLHDYRRYDLHLVCQFFNCQNLWDYDGFDLFFLLLLFRLRLLHLLLSL